MNERDAPTEATTSYTTAEYLRTVFLNPVSAVGIVVAVVGIGLVSLSAPGTPSWMPSTGGLLLLGGTLLFAFGYTLAQRRLGR